MSRNVFLTFHLLTALMLASFGAIAIAQPPATNDDEVQETSPITNTTCPVMPGEKIDPSISVEYEGKTVYLCCKMCRRKFLENPEQYLAALPQFSSLAPEPADEHEEVHAGVNEEPLPEHQHMEEGNQAHEPVATMEHDHTTDHQGVEHEPGARIIPYLGKFHPMVIHFPIALALAALFAEAIFFFGKQDFFRSAGRFCIILAALGGTLAAPLGWAAASVANYPSLELTLEFHRWLGTTAALILVGCAVVSELASRKKSHRLYVAYLTCLVVGSILVGVVGHLGATLIYGPGYFQF